MFDYNSLISNPHITFWGSIASILALSIAFFKYIPPQISRLYQRIKSKKGIKLYRDPYRNNVKIKNDDKYKYIKVPKKVYSFILIPLFSIFVYILYFFLLKIAFIDLNDIIIKYVFKYPYINPSLGEHFWFNLVYYNTMIFLFFILPFIIGNIANIREKNRKDGFYG